MTTRTTTDVLVVGAGVVGLACAFQLQREGKRVTLVDRTSPGMGASFGNAGHIATEQIFPLASPAVVRGAWRYLLDRESPLRIQSRYFVRALPWFVRFAWAARANAYARGVAALQTLQATSAADLATLLRAANAAHLIKMQGHLVLVEKVETVEAANAELATLEKMNIRSAWISAERVREMAPEITAPIQGAMHFTETGHVTSPYAVCETLFTAFCAAGGKFVDAAVTRIDAHDHRFAVHTANTTYDAKQLVLACGAWSKPLAAQLGYAVPLDTERGYHIHLPNVTPRFEIPVASYERKVIMTPMSDGLRMTGTVEFGGLTLPPDPNRFLLLKKHMNALVGNLAGNDATHWMGFRPSLPDHLPVLGRVPDGRELYFAFGHQHLGLTLSGVTARIVAAQVWGRETEIDCAPFSPSRF